MLINITGYFCHLFCNSHSYLIVSSRSKPIWSKFSTRLTPWIQIYDFVCASIINETTCCSKNPSINWGNINKHTNLIIKNALNRSFSLEILKRLHASHVEMGGTLAPENRGIPGSIFDWDVIFRNKKILKKILAFETDLVFEWQIRLVIRNLGKTSAWQVLVVKCTQGVKVI